MPASVYQRKSPSGSQAYSPEQQNTLSSLLPPTTCRSCHSRFAKKHVCIPRNTYLLRLSLTNFYQSSNPSPGAPRAKRTPLPQLDNPSAAIECRVSRPQTRAPTTVRGPAQSYDRGFFLSSSHSLTHPPVPWKKCSTPNLPYHQPCPPKDNNSLKWMNQG